jgi:hypothetical protein
MSTARPTPKRHALGLPAGSVRAILALGVLGLLWAMVLLYRAGRIKDAHGEPALPEPFIYLQYVMVLILAHYFAAHGHTIGTHLGEKAALGLPRGSVRFLLLIGFGGLAVYQLMHRNTLNYTRTDSGAVSVLLGLLVAGFVVGHVLSALIRGASGGESPAWYQDVEAWFALLGMVGLVLLVLVYFVINPSLAAEQQISMEYTESGLAAIIGFYFGARS